MLALALSVLSSSLLMVIFKYFERYRVNVLQAITVNYITAAVLGMTLGGAVPSVAAPWMPVAVTLGVLFILIFNLIALSSQKVGVAVSAVANKMSMVIPVAAGALMLGEPLGLLHIVGIALGLVAVVLVTFSRSGPQVDRRYALLPLVLFVGSGTLDTILNWCRTHLLSGADTPLFSSAIFMVAGTAGMAAVLWQRVRHGATLTPQSIVGGIVLGIPNYFSIHFLLQALHAGPGTVIFPINNTGIVVLSTLLAMALFAERPTTRAWVGIGLAVFSIFILAR